MADITKMFDPLVGQITPHFTTLGERIQAGFDRVCSRLDLISDLLVNDEFIELRRTFNISLTAGTEVSLLEAQLGQEWELDLISSLGAMTITINESGRFRWCNQFSTPGTKNGEGLIMRDGNQYTIVSSGNASPTPVSIQMKLRSYPTPKKTKTVGNVYPSVVPSDGPPADDNVGRHGPVNLGDGTGSISRKVMVT